MNRYSMLILAAALALPACDYTPSTDWHPNFMHWTDITPPATTKAATQSAEAVESTSEETQFGEATENGAMSDTDATEESQGENENQSDTETNEGFSFGE